MPGERFSTRACDTAGDESCVDDALAISELTCEGDIESVIVKISDLLFVRPG